MQRSPIGLHIFGANGFIGRHLANFAHDQQMPAALYSRASGFDARNPSIASLPAPVEREYGVILFAICNIAYAESHREETRELNVAATTALIDLLVATGITPVFFSSDAVFDGVSGGYSEQTPTSPINYYGTLKEEVEQHLVVNYANRSIIVRPSKVYSLESDGTLLHDIFQRLTQNLPIRAAYDQVVNPILVGDLVRILIELLHRAFAGIVHIASKKPLSRYEIAEKAALIAGVTSPHIQRISMDELGPPFSRAKNCWMAIDQLNAMNMADTIDVERALALFPPNRYALSYST